MKKRPAVPGPHPRRYAPTPEQLHPTAPVARERGERHVFSDSPLPLVGEELGVGAANLTPASPGFWPSHRNGEWS